MQICEIFRAKVVDVTKRSVVIEVTGTYDKVDAFERLMRPSGWSRWPARARSRSRAAAARPDL